MIRTNWIKWSVCFAIVCLLLAMAGPRSSGQSAGPPLSGFDAVISQNAQAMVESGRRTFRFDTFGDETFWATPCISTRLLLVRHWEV